MRMYSPSPRRRSLLTDIAFPRTVVLLANIQQLTRTLIDDGEEALECLVASTLQCDGLA